MSTLLDDHDPLQKIFMGFSHCFDFYLQLINDEKLTYRASGSTTLEHDLHGAHLYQLETRSRLPLQSFVRGFFAPPTKNCMGQLNQLHSFSVDDTLDALKTIYQDDNLDSFAHHFSHFLSELVRHKTVIAQYANRAFTTNQTDITKPVQELLESALYTALGLINRVTMTS